MSILVEEIENMDIFVRFLIQFQLMKSSLNRWVQKPKAVQPSKKNSNTSSIIYKQINQSIRNYMGIYDKNKKHHNDRENKNKNKNATKKEHEAKKSSLTPFQPLSNNYMERKHQSDPNTKSYTNCQQLRNFINEEKAENQQVMKVTKKSFDYKYIIGKGGFGKVWKVQHTKIRNQYAMKEMLKSLVMTKKSVQSVMNERLLLSSLNSPFLVNVHYAFQDRDTLYLVLDLMEGGDLRYHLSTKSFSEIQAKFLISCIVLGLEYLHENKIIHRDIKPQNLVLDSRGYIRITDLGIARIKKTNNSSDTSGTPGYMSPQVMCRQNHSYVSDYFALGVIAYEMASAKRPYIGYTRNQIRQQMLAKQVQLKRSELPIDWSLDALDFINRLIQRRPEQRLGFSGIAELKNHPWIKDLNWKKLGSKEIESPFIPLMRKGDFDQDEQITIQNEEEAELIEKNSLLLRKPEFQELFKQYMFNYQAHTTANIHKSRQCSEKIAKEKSGKITPKAPNTSSKTIKNKKLDNTIRNSKQTIICHADYNDTIGFHHYQHGQKNRAFFRN